MQYFVDKSEKIYQDFLKESQFAPRVTSLAPAFEYIASGKILVPNPKPEPNWGLLSDDPCIIACCQYMLEHMGMFAQHYYASIPYALEQDARVMAAVHQYFQKKHNSSPRPFCFYEPSGETGTTSRLIAAMSQGKVHSICCSFTRANEPEFYRLKETNSTAHFYLGVFTDVTPQYLTKQRNLTSFADGFDVIYERCTLQMYGPNRLLQLYHLKQILKEDGILILQGKYSHTEPTEYKRREQYKDKHFKSKYFEQSAILDKNSMILKIMSEGQVTLETMIEAIKPHFRHALLIWNSANFHTLVISNSSQNIQALMSNMTAPCIPDVFNFDGALPQVLVGP